jgi:hypothetical protein
MPIRPNRQIGYVLCISYLPFLIPVRQLRDRWCQLYRALPVALGTCTSYDRVACTNSALSKHTNDIFDLQGWRTSLHSCRHLQHAQHSIPGSLNQSITPLLTALTSPSSSECITHANSDIYYPSFSHGLVCSLIYVAVLTWLC